MLTPVFMHALCVCVCVCTQVCVKACVCVFKCMHTHSHTHTHMHTNRWAFVHVFQAAERVLQSECGEAVAAQFIGNAPCGVYSYALPPSSHATPGAKVIIILTLTGLVLRFAFDSFHCRPAPQCMLKKHM